MTIHDLASHRVRYRHRPADDLQTGDGDGTNPPMYERVAKLEAHMEHVREDLGKLSGVPATLATLNERVSHLPTKDYMVRVALGLLAAIAALIAFGEKLQTLVR